MNKYLLKVCSILLAASLLFVSCGDDTGDTTTTASTTSATTSSTTTTSTTTTETTTTETTTAETTTAKEDDPIPTSPFDATISYIHEGNGIVKFGLSTTGEQHATDVVIDTGAGFVANGNLAYYAYPKTGTYTVSYTVTGNEGTVIEKTLDVVIEEKTKIEGTVICSVPKPNGGGNKDINIMFDGVVPSVGSNDSYAQYDSYVSTEKPESFYAGIELKASTIITGVSFTEGKHFKDGGWFKEAPYIEVLLNGTWVKQDAEISAAYPTADEMSAHGKSFETYTFTFAEAVSCNGVRIAGKPGGSGAFVSIGEIQPIVSTVTSIEKEYTDNEVPLIICDVTTPTGSGARDLRIIADGKVGTDSAPLLQYDTYHGQAGKVPAYIGYLYEETKTVSSVVFTEGMHFAEGGWFANGISLEALIDGEWVKVDAKSSPSYPRDTMASISFPWEVYTFNLTTPVACDGIRIAGICGGNSGFFSVSELTVN